MKIDKENIVSILRSFDNNQMIYIVLNIDVPSVCACYLITEMLKWRMLRYEVTFKKQSPEINLVMRQEETEYILSTETEGYCVCSRREINGISALYDAVKSTGAISVSTVWPMAVTYAFLNNITGHDNRNITGHDNNTGTNNKTINTDTNNKTNNKIINTDTINTGTINKTINNKTINTKSGIKKKCSYCLNLKDDIFIQIKKLNCVGNGIFNNEILSIPFAATTSLLSAIKSHMPFIFQKRLFVRPHAANALVYNCLAQLGISIPQASEKYSQLPESFRTAVNKRFGTENTFVLKNGHDIELTAFEHALLISHFLCTDNDLYALLCLNDRRLMRSEPACNFYQTIMTWFLAAIKGHKRTGTTLVFQMLRHKIEHSCAIDMLVRLLEEYIVYRFGSPRKYVIIYSGEGHFLVHSSFINFTAVIQKLKSKDRKQSKDSEDIDLIDKNTLKLHNNEMISKFIKIISEQ